MSVTEGFHPTGKTEWGSLLVEQPFCPQLQGVGLGWLARASDVPDLLGRSDEAAVLEHNDE